MYPAPSSACAYISAMIWFSAKAAETPTVQLGTGTVTAVGQRGPLREELPRDRAGSSLSISTRLFSSVIVGLSTAALIAFRIPAISSFSTSVRITGAMFVGRLQPLSSSSTTQPFSAITLEVRTAGRRRSGPPAAPPPSAGRPRRAA